MPKNFSIMPVIIEQMLYTDLKRFPEHPLQQANGVCWWHQKTSKILQYWRIGVFEITHD